MYTLLQGENANRESRKKLICFATDNNGLPEEFDLYYFPHIHLPEVIFALINKHKTF